jgi:hypothetical protein
MVGAVEASQIRQDLAIELTCLPFASGFQIQVGKHELGIQGDPVVGAELPGEVSDDCLDDLHTRDSISRLGICRPETHTSQRTSTDIRSLSLARLRDRAFKHRHGFGRLAGLQVGVCQAVCGNRGQLVVGSMYSLSGSQRQLILTDGCFKVARPVQIAGQA